MGRPYRSHKVKLNLGGIFNKKAAKATAIVLGASTWFGAMTAALWLPPTLDAVMTAIEADDITRVRDMARTQSLGAANVCRYNYQAAGVYDAILAHVAEGQVILNDYDPPFRPGAMADMLAQLEARHIVVREIYKAGYSDTRAAFFRAAEDGAPDILALDEFGPSRHMPDFIARVLAEQADMAPGSALVLVHEFGRDAVPHIVRVEPGAEKFVEPADNGNPFGVARDMPRPDC